MEVQISNPRAWMPEAQKLLRILDQVQSETMSTNK